MSTPRLVTLKVEEPAKRQGGVKVGSVAGAGRQAEDRSAGDLMAVLVVAEHDNKALKPATLNAVAAAAEIAKAGGGDVHILVAGKDCRAAAEAAAKIAGVAKVLLADDAAYEHGLAENVAPLAGQARAAVIRICWPPATTLRQELDAAGRRAARRDADLRHQRASSRPTPSCGRSMPATRWRRCSRRTRSRSSPCAAPRFRRSRPSGGSAAVEAVERHRLGRALANSSAPNCRNPSGPN